MNKSNAARKLHDDAGLTQRQRVPGRYIRRYTLRLSEAEIEAVHVLASRKGLPTSALVRQWIQDAYKKVFGKGVE